jgi:hypothetical protein
VIETCPVEGRREMNTKDRLKALAAKEKDSCEMEWIE